MTSLFHLQQQTGQVFEEYFQAFKAAEASWCKENDAAITIQKYLRGFITRRRLDNFRSVVISIQRCWRGYLGRQRALLAREARDKQLRQAYFASQATTIQRYWRGYWSRKCTFDFRARKRYLAKVSDINNKMRSALTEEGDRAAYEQKQLAQATAKAAFDDRVGNLHHLLSTTSQPGIFASPYAMATGQIPVIAGVPVEEHLKTAFKKSAPTFMNSRTSNRKHGTGTFLPPIKSTSNVKDTDSMKDSHALPGANTVGTAADTSTTASPAAGCLSGGSTLLGTRSPGKMIGPYPGSVKLTGTGQVVSSHISLRQSVPYDTVKQAEQVDKKVTKAEMLMLHPVPFGHCIHRPYEPSLSQQSNHNLENYHDPYDPTVGNKTDIFTPRQKSISPTRFVKVPGKQTYFDVSMRVDADGLPPATYMSIPPPHRAAGLTAAETRARALKPAR